MKASIIELLKLNGVIINIKQNYCTRNKSRMKKCILIELKHWIKA